MPSRRILATALLLAAAPVSAQPPRPRPTVTLSAGAAGQADGDRDLGAPGLSAAVGVQWGGARALGVRLEAHGYAYPAQSLPAVVGAWGGAERAGAVAALAVWAPRPRAPYLLAGPGVLAARVTGEAGWAAAAAGAAGLGVPVGGRLAVEAQYLRTARALGTTRGLLAARLRLRL